MFENYTVIYDKNRAIGYVEGCVVMVSWSYNVVTWHVSKEFGGDYVSAFKILEERLKDMESEEQNVFSIIEHEADDRYCLYQRFFFRDEG
ncbi:MAG: hypothetical protein IJY03_04565 [Prevotella sp.]|nr:hypothetical protein [Prevotella sp.]